MVAFAALASGYTQPPEGPETATLIMEKGFTPGLMSSGSRTYFISDRLCGRRPVAADFWAWTKERQKAVRTPSAPLFLSAFANSAQTTGVDHRGVLVRTGTCFAMATFSPKAGRTYDVGVSETCELVVKDQATGEAPPEFQLVDDRDCGKKPKKKEPPPGETAPAGDLR
jgi:hypothetical protein